MIDLLIIVAGWVLIAEWLAIGLYYANPADPFDDPAFGCQDCDGLFTSRRGFELHDCVERSVA